MTAAVLLLLLLGAVSIGALRARATRQRVIVIGAGRLALTIAREIERQPARRWTLVGVVAETIGRGSRWARPRLLGPPEALGEILERLRPDRVVVASGRRAPGPPPIGPLVAARAQGTVVQDGVEAYEWLTGRLVVDELRDGLATFLPPGPRSRADAALRWTLSVGVAVIGLLVTAPLLGVVALAIKLDSRGSVLFRQDRLGLDGRRFRLLKFRTMHPVAGPTSEWAGDNHERITRVGKWLRRFRLDELPQFVNILAGDMNLVGPRPHPVSNAALFNDRIPCYPLRSTVRPGVTGWAQVRYGYANGLDEEREKMRYDLYYIKHQALGLDLRILLATVRTVMLGRGPERTRRRASRRSRHEIRGVAGGKRIAW